MLDLLFHNGVGVPKTLVVAPALCSLSASTDPGNKANAHRKRLEADMSPAERAAASTLAPQITGPGTLGKALDAYRLKAAAPR